MLDHRVPRRSYVRTLSHEVRSIQGDRQSANYRDELMKIAAIDVLSPTFRVIEERVCSNGEQSEADESKCHC